MLLQPPALLLLLLLPARRLGALGLARFQLNLARSDGRVSLVDDGDVVVLPIGVGHGEREIDEILIRVLALRSLRPVLFLDYITEGRCARLEVGQSGSIHGRS